jgi:hypothetical protein
MLTLVERQPNIPFGVNDVVAKAEWHKYGGYWVVSLYSTGDGVRHWGLSWRRNGMPEALIREVSPDAVEYYREICPCAAENQTPTLFLAYDGLWYWEVP